MANCAGKLPYVFTPIYAHSCFAFPAVLWGWQAFKYCSVSALDSFVKNAEIASRQQGYISTPVIYLDMLFNTNWEEPHSVLRALSIMIYVWQTADQRIALSSGPIDRIPGIPRNDENRGGLPFVSNMVNNFKFLGRYIRVTNWYQSRHTFQCINLSLMFTDIGCKRLSISQMCPITNEFVALKSKNRVIWWYLVLKHLLYMCWMSASEFYYPGIFIQIRLFWNQTFELHFHMFPQIACKERCKNTLVAFVWLFSDICVYKCVPSKEDA